MKRHASLNRLFRLIWSRVQNGWIPVAELARRAGKGRHRALIALPFLAAGTAVGAPDGGQVVSGTGTIAQSAATTTISQSSQNLSLTWQTFDVGTHETVNFEQPSASAIAVNRIFDTNGSQILGRLNANGQVFLINPNGVLFGQDAQVNVGGLVASTLDTDDASGDVKRFHGNGTGSVANYGEITAADGGYVALLGNRVSNQGTINAPLGSVALGAGNAVTLTFQNNSLLTLQVDESVLDNAADNGGLIRADGGMVVMSAGAKDALLASVVNNTGMIEARTVEHRDGTIVLLGGMQAGTVNVSGTLDASAPDGGDGGFIDTSAAHVKIADDVKITTAAASGRTGTWLIDPVDFTIAASGGDITGATLSSNLGSTDVIIESVTGSAGTSGDVNVNDVVEWSANRLTLNAANNINVNAAMNASGSASLALEFGQAALAAGNTSNVITNNAAINLPAGTTNFTTKLGSDGVVKAYTVITSLGDVGSTTTSDLQGVGGDLTGNYALGANIDAAATSAWNAGEGFMPLGNGTTRFTGTFEGLGHTVSNLTINRPITYVGLFGYISDGAVIQNVGLVDGSVAGASQVGPLVGQNNSSTVNNSYATTDVSGGNYVGGLVGYGFQGQHSNVHASGTVSGASFVGGLIGWHAGISGTLVDGHATGSVSGSGYVGGLVGGIQAGSVSNSSATGSVYGSGTRIGGLAGTSSGTITNSHANAAVEGSSIVGGLVGRNQGGIENSYSLGTVLGVDTLGGLVGRNTSTITNSYSSAAVTGIVTGSPENEVVFGGLVGLNSGAVSTSYATGTMDVTPNDAGGLVGLNTGTVTNAYWNTETTGQATSAGGAGLTSTEMRTAANFGGFTFTATPGASGNNWVMVNADGTLNNAGVSLGATRPMLASEYSTTITNSHQLQLMAMDVTASYSLGNDIDASATGGLGDVWDATGFVPVGGSAALFTGRFDGLGRVVSQLTINRPGTDYAGLFGYANGAVIENVGLLDGNVIAVNYVGGLVGFHENGTINNSYFAGDVKRGTNTGNNVGGLVGASYGAISDSFADVNVGGSSHVGGLVGRNEGVIQGSYAVGTLLGSNRLGGFVGTNGSFGTIATSYSSVAVTSNFFNQDIFGGLVGENIGAISQSFANGVMVVNQIDAGGLVGRGGGTVTHSFWDTELTGQATSAGGTGMASADMQTEANFTSATVANGNMDPGWDFADTWLSTNGSSAPLLNALMIDVTVTADDVTRTYDGSIHSGGYSMTVDGHLPGGLGFTGSSQSAINANSYAITPDSASYANKQFVVTAVDGSLTINPADLIISSGDVSKTYDAELSAAGSAIVTGGTLFGGDSVAGGTFAFADKNVGHGDKTVTTSGVAVIDGNNGNNYNVSYADNTSSTISAAGLTLRASDVSKTYDAGLSAAGRVIVAGGTLFGDDSVAGGTFAFTDKNVGHGDKTVTASGVTVIDGNSGNNYNISYIDNTSSTITAANLAVTGVSASNRSYDGSLAAALSGTAAVTALGSDSITLDGIGAGAFADRHAGSGKAVTVNGYSLSGTDAGNYVLVQPAGLTADITAANLTLTSSDVSKTYDAGLSAAGNAVVTSGTLFGDDTVTGGSFAFTDKNVGHGDKTVTTSGVTVIDGNGGNNYNLTYTDNTSSTITAAILAITGVSVLDKHYDGTAAATLVGAATVAAFESDSVTVADTGMAVFSDPEIGADKAVAVSGFSLIGADADNYLIVQPSGLTADIIATETTTPTIPLPVSRIASQVTSLLSMPQTIAQQRVLNSAPADVASATDFTVSLNERGSNVRVVNGGLSLPENWITEDE